MDSRQLIINLIDQGNKLLYSIDNKTGDYVFAYGTRIDRLLVLSLDQLAIRLKKIDKI